MKHSIIALLFWVTPLVLSDDSKQPPGKIQAKLESGTSEVRIVCFGDSVTGLYYHTGGQRTYTDMLGIALKQIYPKAKIRMINAGISGHTTVNALARIEKDVLVRKPDLVTVMFGLNDLAKVKDIAVYEKNLEEIVNRCRAINAEVVLCTPNSVVTTKARPKEDLIEYCDAVRKVAAKHRVPLCDSFAAFEKFRRRDQLGWRLTMSDEIHPNMAGHKMIAEQLALAVTGKQTSLAEISPPSPAIDKTLALLKAGKPVKILAIPPYDKLIGDAFGSVFPKAKTEIITWPVDGLSLYMVRKDASHRVRKLKPNLVLIAIPRSAKADTQEQFIHDQHWAACYSLAFGKKEWDTVVIHPSVNDPKTVNKKNDDLIRKITAAHDLSLIDRAREDSRSAGEILSAWLKSQR